MADASQPRDRSRAQPECAPRLLTTAQRDRVAGALLGTAAGDALGAGYEFGPPLPAGTVITMRGGGAFRWAPGEWTDDTSMAIVIARVAADGLDLRSAAAQDRIATGWLAWAQTATDVGSQTRAVFGAVRRGGTVDAAAMRAAAEALHEKTGRTGGNGSLMRTAPVALAYLDDEAALVAAATSLSSITHYDPEAGEACALWCLAIRHAVLTGELDVRRGLTHLAPERAAVWAARLDEAEAKAPPAFEHNGWVVHALQGAWSAISRTPVPVENASAEAFPAQHLQLALAEAVRGGRDTDTVAAIAGGLLGAAWGASAVPAAWRRILHGWPGLGAVDLVELASRIAGTHNPPHYGRPRLRDAVASPHDPGLLLGDLGSVAALPAEVDVVVSLCRMVPGAVPDGVEHLEVRLIDKPAAAENPHLRFVLADAVALLEALRAEGKTVLLHCVAAQSRTPTVAALYGARRTGSSAAAALAEVVRVLPGADPNVAFRELLASWEQAR